MKLHWANADQYYVKTTENYASYAFTASAGDAARRVRFEVASADNEKDNVKEANGRQRRFVLAAGGNASPSKAGSWPSASSTGRWRRERRSGGRGTAARSRAASTRQRSKGS